MKRLLITKIIILCLCVSSTSVIAEPVVENVTISPEEPKVKDTVTITATITNEEDIDEVTFRIKECDENICMQTQSYQMNLVDDKYTVTVELTYILATYFSYQLVISSNGNETETEFVNVTLQPADNGGINGGNGGNGDGDGGIPVFEFILIIVVVLIGVIVFVIIRK